MRSPDDGLRSAVQRVERAKDRRLKTEDCRLGICVSDALPAPEALTEFSPAEPAPSPLRAKVTALFEVLLCSSVPTQVALTALLQSAGWNPLDEAGQLSLPFVLTL